jgi:hypothetical protein
MYSVDENKWLIIAIKDIKVKKKSLNPPVQKIDSRSYILSISAPPNDYILQPENLSNIFKPLYLQYVGGSFAMKYMIIIKADKNSEAGILPSTELLTAMGKFNEELVKEGLMLAAEGLHPSSQGARVSYKKGKWSVTDGPFPETKELIAGYWIWKVKSKEEALEWVKRIPNPDNDDFEVEIRKVGDADDFGENFTPERRERK